MRVLIAIGLVERNFVTDKGKHYLTIRDLSGSGAVELSAGEDLDCSALREGAVVRLDAEVQGFGYNIEGSSRRGFGLRLLEARVTPLADSLEELVGKGQAVK